jgi:hypothetical protein
MALNQRAKSAQRTLIWSSCSSEDAVPLFASGTCIQLQTSIAEVRTVFRRDEGIARWRQQYTGATRKHIPGFFHGISGVFYLREVGLSAFRFALSFCSPEFSSVVP